MGPVGTGAQLANALRSWSVLRFEVTEDPTVGSDGSRWSHTPALGIHHASTNAIGDAVEYMPGVTGVHSTASEAWPARQGVCQDIAHITLGALRSVGIPARYVSGYLHPNDHAEVGAPTVGESHAWVEWFAGDWQGFDPTNGIEIGDRHVLVGRGRDYNDVPPLRGVYAGPHKGDLHVQVLITREA